jgi:MFS family permease
MHTALDLLRDERQLRWFFAAHLQGSLGAGAGYVALLVLAYDRIGSGWAATAVLLADLAPSMLLGPLAGAVADRWGARRCAIVADLLRAAALAALAFVGGIVPMLALAVVLGCGNALFRPATSALLPALVSEKRLTGANALYGAARDAGQLLGPVCAAGVLLFTGPEALLAVNGATFLASALLLTRVQSSGRPAAAEETLLAETLVGVRAVLAEPLTRTLVCSSGAILLVAGTMNVAELVLAQEELGAGHSGFALLVGAYGCGLVAGALLGADDTDDRGLTRRYLLGLTLLAAGLLGSSIAPALPVALATFALTGLGNGLFIVSDRVLLQRIVPRRLHGRAFGLLDSVDSWGFGGALLAGGVLASTVGGRMTFAIAGTGALLVWAAARSRLVPPTPATKEPVMPMARR